MRRAYELKNGNDLLGHLRFTKSCGSLASAQVASRTWTFKREGFLNPRVTVRLLDADMNQAVFHPNWGGGVVEFPDGRQIQWRSKGFWRSEWCFLQNNIEPLLCFKQSDGFLKASARLEINSANSAQPELPMLAALAFYLMVLSAEDDATAVAVTATLG